MRSVEESYQSLPYTVNEVLNRSCKLFYILGFSEGIILGMLPSSSLSSQSFSHFFTSRHYVPTPRLALMAFAIRLFCCKVPKGQPETPLGKIHKVTLAAAILNEFRCCLRLLQLQSLLHRCKVFAECLGTPGVWTAGCVTP